MTDELAERADWPARAEQRVVEVVGLLAGLVRRLRTPLLWVSLLPVLPALVLLFIAIDQHRWFPGLIAVAGLVPSGWLTRRRRQLVSALEPPAVAVAELRAVFSPAELGNQLRTNLLAVRGKSLRPRQLARSVWRGVKLTAATHARYTDVPRLAPFLPGRLRGLAFLTAACVVSGAVLAVFALLGLVVTSPPFFG